MLKLRKGRPPFVPVDLGGGAVIRVRPATSADVEEAGARAQRDIMGFVAGSDAGDVLAEVLGDDFNVRALKDSPRVMPASARLAEVYLVLACHDGWSGIGTEDGEPIPEPDAATLAMLLADPRHRYKIISVVNASLHEETAEKNVSDASPNGGAGIPTGAPTAGAAGSHAQPGSSSTATEANGSDARRSSTLH
jgi:hypothetical protein